MHFDDALGDGETETGSALRASAGEIDLLELFEDPRMLSSTCVSRRSSPTPSGSPSATLTSSARPLFRASDSVLATVDFTSPDIE